METKQTLMVNVKNLTKQTILMGNVFIKTNSVESIPAEHYDILKKNYGDKIERIVIDQDVLKRLENDSLENIELKKRIAELENKNQEPEKIKEDKTPERIAMETKAKELGIKVPHLLGDEKLANKIMEIETAPTV
jgi:hypothetical protein